MPLSDANWTGLIGALPNWLKRSDLTTAVLGDMLWLFEKKFNAELRLRNAEGVTTIGITSGYLTHPADWLQWKSITVIQGQYRTALGPLTEENASVDYGYSYLGFPRGFVVRGDKTIIYPAPGSGTWTYETVYQQAVPALTVSATTNWLLTAYPQAYLYGSLLESTLYNINDERIPLWKSAVDEALFKIEQASKKAKYSGAVMTARPDSVC